jgi:DNA-binding response OmpR family regulator
MTAPIIALVDDNRRWAQTAAGVLREAGFEVRLAFDGEEALDLLTTVVPALLILDVRLPRIDGLHILEQFRRQDVQTPVLVISGDDQAAIQDRAMTAGANGFLRKPISMPLLLRAIERLLCQTPRGQGQLRATGQVDGRTGMGD